MTQTNNNADNINRLRKIIDQLNTHHLDHSTKNNVTHSFAYETYPLSTKSMRKNLYGKTIFISGGSRGIGLAIAKRCAQDTCNIVIAAKTASPHPKLPGTIYTAAKQIASINGSKCLPIICDIRKEEMVKNAVKQAIDTFGGIDIVINNASAIDIHDTEQTTMKKYDLMHAVNVRGTFMVTKYCLKYLKKSNKNPHILTLSPPINYAASRDGLFSTAYITSKIGMSLCTMMWSKELRKWNIAANSLWPRTTIATAAVQRNVSLLKKARIPQIHADAAYLILTQPSHIMNGYFVRDEDILRQDGVTDFEKYKFDPNIHKIV
eukprot:274518_1